MTAYSDRPAIMAIGDSMYQGVRSLSFSAATAPIAPPAQVAAALGRPMNLPNPRIPILYDLEQIFRHGGLINLLSVIRDACLENIAFWRGPEPWSQHEAFDNVAIGGATIESLWTDTYAQSWATIPGLVANIQAKPVPDVGSIGRLWYALNVAFTLNPGKRPAQAAKTQLDQAADRKPGILLVNIGSNEGLFHAAFTGDFSQASFDAAAGIPAKMEALGQRLAALPPEIELIVVNSLVRPRTASNLMPVARPGMPPDPDYPGDGYFSLYGPSIGGGSVVPGATVKRYDDAIRAVNDQVRQRLEATVGARLAFVDLYEATTRFDGKHYADRGVIVTPGGRFHRLSNTALNLFLGSLMTGGLTGLDNMHPTAPGYGLIANAVLEAMGATPRVDMLQAYQADSLLQNLPHTWNLSHIELAVLGSLGVFSSGALTG
jgi:hypothetical protein